MLENIKKMRILGLKYALELKPDPNIAVISITNPDEQQSLTEEWGSNILRLKFWDAEKQKHYTTIEEREFLFNEVMATKIKEFLERLPENIEELIVHCHFGVSRSAGVGLAINDALSLDLLEAINYMAYNREVYKYMRNTLLNEKTTMNLDSDPLNELEISPNDEYYIVNIVYKSSEQYLMSLVLNEEYANKEFKFLEDCLSVLRNSNTPIAERLKIISYFTNELNVNVNWVEEPESMEIYLIPVYIPSKK